MSAANHGLLQWADLCTTDFSRLDPERTVAVLPVAAVEQHGPHLPLAVDLDILQGILSAAGPECPSSCPAYVLPVQAVGLSPEHAQFPGTLNLSPETVIRLWTDIGASVARSGVHKLLIFNSHGGHAGIMDVVARELRAHHGLLVYSVSWFNLPLLDQHGSDLNARFSPEEHRFGIHAGQIETSMMLALRPAVVHMEHARYFTSSSQIRAGQYPILGNGRSAKLGWQMQDYNPEGAVGNAACADTETGYQLIAAAGRALAQLLKEFSDLPLSTLADAPSRST